MALTDQILALATRIGVEIKATTAKADAALGSRGGGLASNSTPLNGVDVSFYRDIAITALATNITDMSTGTTGTLTRGMTLTITIKDNGTPRTIAWGTLFMAGPAPLVTTTVASKTHTLHFRYDSAASKYVCLASDAVGY